MLQEMEASSKELPFSSLESGGRIISTIFSRDPKVKLKNIPSIMEVGDLGLFISTIRL